jgi:DNA repair exonuclease SbcCD ATPase subunit
MKIELKRLSLKNFKGIIDMTVDFTTNTILKGNNATGKTTVFDAFTWLLFGKDSSDRTNFNIKNTVNTKLNRTDHEVAAHLIVDGIDIEMKRTYREKWQTKRGSAVEEFTGHETIFFVNDVPCSQKEFTSKVEEICNEDLFKLITNPLYFPYLKWQSQREILFGMAGEVKDEDIAEGNEKFAQLLAALSGKTLEEFKREIAAKKKRIKDELAFIPGRIDEVSRTMPAVADYGVIEIQLAHKQAELTKAEAALTDISKASKDKYEAKQALQAELYTLKTKKQQLEHDAKTKMDAERLQAGSEKRTLESSITLQKQRIEEAKTNINNWKRQLEGYNAKRAGLIEQWDAENAKQLIFNENDFCCPTCKRAFDMQDIDAKQAEMTTNFNETKANVLAEITANGKAVKSLIEQTTATISQREVELTTMEAELTTAVEKFNTMPDVVSIATMIPAEMEEAAELEEKIIALQKQIDAPIDATNDDSELKALNATLQSEIEAIKKKLYEKEIIAKSNARIDELKLQQRTMANEIAQLEGTEFLIMEFTKAKVETIEKRVNSMFELVTFRLFEMQVNGQEVETCVAMVEGVPYPDLNNAAKINAGMDILKTISQYRNISAPVFIDNAEAVVELLHIPTQTVRLVVADQTLEVINN